MIKLFGDLKWAMDDPCILVFSYLSNAKKYGLFTSEEFTTGCNKLGVKSLEGLSAKKQELKTTYLDN
jgi:hypothetical protein